MGEQDSTEYNSKVDHIRNESGAGQLFRKLNAAMVEQMPGPSCSEGTNRDLQGEDLRCGKDSRMPSPKLDASRVRKRTSPALSTREQDGLNSMLRQNEGHAALNSRISKICLCHVAYGVRSLIDHCNTFQRWKLRIATHIARYQRSGQDSCVN